MVYGERLNTFDESRKDLLEFQNAVIELLARIANASPLYKYFRTKIYRHFVAAVSCVHEHGTFMVVSMCTVLYAQMWYI